MKIAWFTPFHDKSAIGYYSKLACEAVSKYHEVTIFTPNANTYQKTGVSVVPFSDVDLVLKQIESYDFICYNLGNHYDNHFLIYNVLQQKRGIVIAHDLSMFDFAYVYYARRKNLTQFFKYIQARYGVNLEEKILTTPIDPMYTADYPCMDWYCRYAAAVIVHSKYHLSKLQAEYAGIKKYIAFPYRENNSNMPYNHNVHGKVKILTVGGLNINKRILEVIDVIGKLDKALQSCIEYHVVGMGDRDYHEKLMKAIEKYNLGKSIILHGYSSDVDLQSLYNDADILINLRYPTIEGASWSLVEQLMLGKPIIVSRTGCYDEIPDDCVIKITPGQEEKEISEALQVILNRPDLVKELGKRAYTYAKCHYSEEIYVNAFNELLENVALNQPIEELIDNVASEEKKWGNSCNEKFNNGLSKRIGELFSNRYIV